jgi:hypothetical protein
MLTLLRGFSQFLLLRFAGPLDSVLALTLSLHVLVHHVADVLLTLLGFQAFLLVLFLLL